MIQITSPLFSTTWFKRFGKTNGLRNLDLGCWDLSVTWLQTDMQPEDLEKANYKIPPKRALPSISIKYQVCCCCNFYMRVASQPSGEYSAMRLLFPHVIGVEEVKEGNKVKATKGGIYARKPIEEVAHLFDMPVTFLYGTNDWMDQ